MTTAHDLGTLLKLNNCKLTSERIPADSRSLILNFLELELQERQNYRQMKLMRCCGISKNQMRTFDQLDWHFNPKMPRQELLAMRGSNWIDEPQNLVLIGDAGIGKTHIAKALCYEAILKGHSAYFISVFDLISKIKKSPHPAHRIDYYGSLVKVLCLDELGYVYHRKEDTDLIFQIVSKRSEVLPTIVTTNLAPKNWGSIFSGAAASAILDRLSFNGKFITWEGRSYRLTANKK